MAPLSDRWNGLAPTSAEEERRSRRIAGKPDESIVRLVNGQAKIRMPFERKPLPACLRQNIRSWIFEGAKNN